MEHLNNTYILFIYITDACLQEQLPYFVVISVIHVMGVTTRCPVGKSMGTMSYPKVTAGFWLKMKSFDVKILFLEVPYKSPASATSLFIT